jgi:hypothetical protein
MVITTQARPRALDSAERHGDSVAAPDNPGSQMLKKILIGVVAIVIVIGAGLYMLYSNLGGIVKAAIESYGSAATQATVTVDKVDLSATSGEGSIGGLFIGNPTGFATPQAMSVGTVLVKVDTSSIGKGPIVIKEIIITQPKITYERGATTGNLETLQQNVTRYAGAGKSSPAATPAGKDEPKVIIENLYVREGQIAISHAALQGRTLSSSLPTLHLKDIGRDKGGATPGEVAERVLGAITQQASRIASVDLDKALGQLKGAVGDQLKNVPAAAAPVGDRLQGILGAQPK